MCDRYTISASQEVMKNIFGIEQLDEYEVNFNSGPTQEVPVLLSNNPKTVQNMTWGLISKWSNNKSISPKLFNLPIVHATEKKMYQHGLKENRCLILADGFYVWKQIGKTKSVPYYFFLPERKPFGIAALWESYEDMDGKTAHTCIMLTREATTEVSAYQEDMPLVLQGDLMDNWLNHKFEILEHSDSFIQPDVEKFKFHSVSPLISSLNNNHEGLIKAASPSDQHGNYTLFN